MTWKLVVGCAFGDGSWSGQSAQESTEGLRQSLLRATELVKGYSEKGWIKRFANSQAQEFSDSYREIERGMQLLQFDFQVQAPIFVDETKLVRDKVKELTGLSYSEGGFEACLKQEGGLQQLCAMLNVDTKVVLHELDALKVDVHGIDTKTGGMLNMMARKEVSDHTNIVMRIMQRRKLTDPAEAAAKVHVEMMQKGTWRPGGCAFHVGFRMTSGGESRAVKTGTRGEDWDAR
eukprot:gene8906-10552_t